MFADWKLFCQATRMKQAPRRRPKVGGYARGDETRAHIVIAALQVFGERGFDQAATRDIAAKAGVTPPALQYYFDSKEGLHRACAQYIIDRASPWLQPVIQHANSVALQNDKEAALQALEQLLDALTDSLTEPGTESWSRFILRSKYDGAGPGVEMLRAQISIPTIDAVAGLLAMITGVPASSEVTRLRTLLVFGQIHWMHAGREQALKIMNWSKLDAAKIAMIKKMVHENTRSMLAEYLGPGTSPRLERVRPSPRD
jgi:AcrR family transcriptional regulator